MALEHRISELDTYLFAKGTHYEIYEKMGAHLAEEDGKAGTYFSVWAPNARSVSVVGDFNNRDRTAHPMQPVQQSGIWDIFVPGVKAGTMQKKHSSLHRLYQLANQGKGSLCKYCCITF